MSDLTGSTIASTYDRLLSLPSGGGNGATLVAMTDGNAGNTFALEISTGEVKSTGTLTAAGAATLSTSVTLATGATVTGIDNATLATGSATLLATQGAIKTYVDAQVAATNELSEVLAAGNTTGSNNIIVDASQKITTDTIDETTAAAGVTIDSVLVKDNTVTATTFTGDLTGDVTGNVTATSILANGVTATTQTASDNSTKVATTAYVDAQVETSDTLSEVLANGNTTGSSNISVNAGQSIGVDTITETTSAAGVTIDSVLLKDNEVTATTFTGALTGTASKATVTDSSDNTAFPVVFNDESDALLDDTGGFTYNPSSSTVAATTFTGALTGDASGSSGSCTGNSATATLATTVTVTDSTADTAFPVAFHDESNALLDDTGAFTYNPNSSTVAATTFSGALTGNVTGDVSGSSGSCTGNSATATLASTVTVTDSTADTAFPVTFHDESNALLDDTGAFTYNPNSSTVSATTFAGALTGDASGSSGSCTGNAATATLASTVTVTDSTTDTAFPVTFHDESNALLDDTGAFTYNPNSSTVTATAFAGGLTGDVTGNVSGTAATVTGATQASITTCANLVTVGTVTSGTWGTGSVIGGTTMTLGSDGTGDIYYRAAGGVLTRLGNSGGGDDDKVLTLASGLPTWAAAGGGGGSGTVTEVTVGTGLDVADGTTTPDITLSFDELTNDTGTDANGWTSGDFLTIVESGGTAKRIMPPAEICIAASDETTVLTSSNAATFLVPRKMKVTEVKASLTTKDDSNDTVVDVLYSTDDPSSTSSILDSSFYCTITAGDYVGSTTAFTGTTSEYSLELDSFIRVDVSQTVTFSAQKGLKVWLLGYWE